MTLYVGDNLNTGV